MLKGQPDQHHQRREEARRVEALRPSFIYRLLAGRQAFEARMAFWEFERNKMRSRWAAEDRYRAYADDNF